MGEAVILQFKIQGRPAPQGSKRHVGHGRMIDQSKYLRPWRDTLSWVMRTQYRGKPLDTPLEVTAVFYMPRPKNPTFHVPAVPPDLDKLARALNDALTDAGVIKNDSRIVSLNVTKDYHPEGWTGVMVTVAAVE